MAILLYYIGDINIMRRIIATILTAFCALTVSGCRDWNDKTITYRLEGGVSNATVTYHDEYEDLIYHSSVKVPWEKTFNIQFRSIDHYGGGARGKNYTAYVSAGVFNRPSFPLIASIYVDGELVKSDTTMQSNVQAEAYYIVRYCD
jgi:hypothetical protein